LGLAAASLFFRGPARTTQKLTARVLGLLLTLPVLLLVALVAFAVAG
jgi:hypothetical protein